MKGQESRYLLILLRFWHLPGLDVVLMLSPGGYGSLLHKEQ